MNRQTEIRQTKYTKLLQKNISTYLRYIFTYMACTYKYEA